jgi:hypothetical protein
LKFGMKITWWRVRHWSSKRKSGNEFGVLHTSSRPMTCCFLQHAVISWANCVLNFSIT